jgi:hypothetical protein
MADVLGRQARKKAALSGGERAGDYPVSRCQLHDIAVIDIQTDDK